MEGSFNILLWFIILVNVVIIGWGLMDKRRLLRFPVLFALSFSSFAVPQLIGLAYGTGTMFSRRLPEGALDILLLVSLLCIIAVLVGDIRGVNHPGAAPVRTVDSYRVNRLIQAGFGLTAASVLISVGSRLFLPPEYFENLGNQWTGAVTIILFFQSMQKYGFALCILLYFRTRSPLALICGLFNIVTYFYSFMVIARRGATIDLFFIIVLGLMFTRRLQIPGWLLVLFFACGTLWSNSIGSFRDQINDDLTFIEKIERVDMLQYFNETINNGGWELTNAAVSCWSADHLAEYDFGKIHWNQLVHAYFPGQLFGYEVKQSLKFDAPDLPKQLLNYVPPTGTTSTGMADAFCSFWYFGAVKYFIIGYVMGRWWNRAMRGDVAAELAYMALMGSSLHTITHATSWLLNSYIHMVIFAYPCLYWARLGVPLKQPALDRRPSPVAA